MSQVPPRQSRIPFRVAAACALAPLLLSLPDTGRTQLAASPRPNPAPDSFDFFQSRAIHDDLSRFLALQNKRLKEDDAPAYLEHFSEESGVRSKQTTLLALSRVSPVRNLAFSVSTPQRLAMDEAGRVAHVSVSMAYDIVDGPTNHPFRSSAICDFKRAPETGTWTITRFAFEKQPPFWLFGLSRSMVIDHFLIFYRPSPASGSILSKTRRQLEGAYAKLSKHAHLPLADRYIVFLLDRETDFARMTSSNASRFSGASSSGYHVSEDRLSVTNRAMFLNDSRLLHSTRLARSPDRGDVIVHELVHLALAGHTRPFTPPWLVEGIATCLAGQRSPDSRKALIRSGAVNAITLSGLSRGKLTGGQFGSSLHLRLEYTLSAETVAYLLSAYGEKRFFDFYRAFGQVTLPELESTIREAVPPQPGTPVALPKLMHHLTLKLTQEYCGISLYELDRVVKTRLAAGKC